MKLATAIPFTLRTWVQKIYGPRSKAPHGALRTSFRPRLEVLEDRLAPALITEVGGIITVDLNQDNENLTVVSTSGDGEVDFVDVSGTTTVALDSSSFNLSLNAPNVFAGVVAPSVFTGIAASIGTLTLHGSVTQFRIISSATGTSFNTVSPTATAVTLGAEFVTGAVKYDGAPHGASASWASTGNEPGGAPLTVTYTGVGGTVYGPSTTAPTNGGQYQASASFAGDATHTGSSNSLLFFINPAPTATTVTLDAGFVADAITYDGAPHGATASWASTGTAPGGGPLTVTYTGINGTVYGPSTTKPTDAGNYRASAEFSGDANFAFSSRIDDFAINVSPTTTTLTLGAGFVSGAITYDGAPHGATASWARTGTGAGGGPLTVTYTGINGTVYGPSTTKPTDAGEYEASASFPGDDNHSGSSDAKNFTINQATPTFIINATGGDYTGKAYPATGSVIGVNGINLGTPTFKYYRASDTAFAKPLLAAPKYPGRYVVVASYAGSANYKAASATEDFIILTPEATLTATIKSLVSSGVLTAAQGNHLQATLNRATSLLAAGKRNQGVMAMNAFKAEVKILTWSARLTPAHVQVLNFLANAILTLP